MLSLCNHWEFVPEWSDAFAAGEGQAVSVRLPHTVKEIPLHYADHNAYQMICGYRRNWKASGSSCSLTVRPILPRSM